MLVAADAAKLADDIAENVILTWAHVGKFGHDQLMDRENIRHFDVKRWFCLCVKIVELVDVVVLLRRWHRDDCLKGSAKMYDR